MPSSDRRDPPHALPHLDGRRRPRLKIGRASRRRRALGGVPRLADGHPDLQGMYDLATLTPVERPAGTPLVMSDEQAAKLEKDVAARKNYQDAR